MSATYSTVHSNAGSLTHWTRPGIKPASSWILVRFIYPEPRQELPLFPFLAHFSFPSPNLFSTQWKNNSLVFLILKIVLTVFSNWCLPSDTKQEEASPLLSGYSGCFWSVPVSAGWDLCLQESPPIPYWKHKTYAMVLWKQTGSQGQWVISPGLSLSTFMVLHQAGSEHSYL